MSPLRMLLTGFIVAMPAAAAAQQSPDLEPAVDPVFERWASESSPGCAVGVTEDGHAVLSRAYGMADLEHDIRNTPTTIFEAGSVSKQFTAAAVLLLVEDGALSLDDDVRKYVPELPDYGHTITLRHLLTHTSGLRDWGSVAEIAGWGRSVRTHTHDHVVDILSRQRALNFTPGAEYSYSNSGYNLLAVIVDRTSGVSFAEFSRTRIFEPLGMMRTQWRDDYTRIVKGRSSAYGRDDNEWVIDRPIENVHGNGGLLTTVADLLTWNQALTTGAIGGPRLSEMMVERGVLNSGRVIEYASGLVVSSFRGVPEISHTGSTSGYRAFLARYPDQRLGVAVLCNAGNVNPGAVGRSVAQLLLGDRARPVVATEPSEPPPPPPARPVLTAAQLDELTGEYYSPDTASGVEVTIDDGRIVMYRRPATRLNLTPLTDDVFDAGPLGRVRFIRDDRGAVTQLSVQQSRVYDLRFDRVP